MNAVLHHLQQWKQVPLDVICVSLFHLCSYYHREIERGFHQCGAMEVKDQFKFYERDPSLMPCMPKTVDPKEIVNMARGELMQFSNKECDDDTTVHTVHAAANTQIGLALDALHKKHVTLADNGCWVVKGTDGTTPYAVTLFPKEVCSCPAAKTCYHLMACKLMIGQKIDDIINPNMTLLHQKNRRRQREKPSGRKAPRKNDFTKSNDDKRGLFINNYKSILHHFAIVETESDCDIDIPLKKGKQNTLKVQGSYTKKM